MASLFKTKKSRRDENLRKSEEDLMGSAWRRGASHHTESIRSSSDFLRFSSPLLFS
jgi:hypothetical protein